MAAVVLMLAACGRDVTSTPGDAPNEKWVEGERARPAQPLEPLPVMRQFETFEYSAQGLRDPFTDTWTNPQQGMADCVRIRTGARSRWRLPAGCTGHGRYHRHRRRYRGAGDGAGQVTYRVRPGTWGRATGGSRRFEDHVELIELVPDGAGWLERPATLA